MDAEAYISLGVNTLFAALLLEKLWKTSLEIKKGGEGPIMVTLKIIFLIVVVLFCIYLLKYHWL